MSPFAFLEVAYFFIRGLLNEPFVFLRVASFFIGGLSNKPMNEGSDSVPLLMILISCVKHLSNFLAKLVSYFDSSFDMSFLGTKLY
jgi:hypothetical protein